MFKRDTLLAIEKQFQKDWERHIFEVDMPEDDSVDLEKLHEKYPKWVGTFPYPYMNGILHLGHGFSASKLEVSALFLFGFHVTGMPIKAAEDLGDKVAEMSNFRSKKTKATARFGSHKHQFQIAKFAYAQHWLEYYPPIAIEHLKSMGCKIDWRRAFLTTDYNPYYDSFARWQFERLHEMGKINAKDGQPCMDHDRQTGEGLQGNKVISAIPQLEGKKIFLTMYGQTNCFVGTGLEYGFYQSENPNEVYVVTARLTPANDQVILLGTVNGQATIGSKVDAPLSTYSSGVYVLPMENVLATKSTGVVTSVSSESPDDYAKTEYYGIKPEWVDEFEPVPVTSIPAFDAMPASALCKNDHAVYKEGFYNSTMSYVQAANMKVRDLLIANGSGFAYAESEKPVMSRSADDCVYFDYGESTWKAAAGKCLTSMETYGEDTRHQFQQILDWLKQWPCVRSHSLGSRVPWNPSYLIESLSLAGSKIGLLGITPKDMDSAAWDYVLLGKDLPTGHSRYKELAMLRRSSGKALMQSDLTFFIYIHSALFPKSKWPRSMSNLGDSCKLYDVDATRITLADAGDGIDDANFEMTTADAAIRSLYTLMEKSPNESVKLDDVYLCVATKPFTAVDEVHILATDDAYEAANHRDALKCGFHDFTNIRGWYMKYTITTGMHSALVRKWIERQHVWKTIMGNSNSIMDFRWPTNNLPTTTNHAPLMADDYVEITLKKRSKKKDSKTISAASAEFDPNVPKSLGIFVANESSAQQKDVISVLKDNYDSVTGTFDDKATIAALSKKGVLKNKKTMPFAQEIKKRVATIGSVAFDRGLTFMEVDLLSEIAPAFKNNLGFAQINIISVSESANLTSTQTKAAESAVLGELGFLIANSISNQKY
ncbi:hypothetical protein BX070DRAFT_220046 [Coemansia spiralis]|nr:hypothetical protein BX070DRAFT_220046 [Coemansia spiralis]